MGGSNDTVLDKLDAIELQIRTLNSRLAADISWAVTRDRSARTARGRQAADERFVKQARELHPDASEEDVRKAAENLRRAHFTKMAIASAKSRRAKAGQD